MLTLPQIMNIRSSNISHSMIASQDVTELERDTVLKTGKPRADTKVMSPSYRRHMMLVCDAIDPQ